RAGPAGARSRRSRRASISSARRRRCDSAPSSSGAAGTRDCARALPDLLAAKPDRVLSTNVEFWAALALDGAGILRELFTPGVAVARTLGWTAHVAEQVRNNRLIRPVATCVGPAPRASA